MTCAENTVQGTALRHKLGLSVPVISLLAAICAVVGFVAWARTSVRGAPDALRPHAAPEQNISWKGVSREKDAKAGFPRRYRLPVGDDDPAGRHSPGDVHDLPQRLCRPARIA